MVFVHFFAARLALHSNSINSNFAIQGVHSDPATANCDLLSAWCVPRARRYAPPGRASPASLIPRWVLFANFWLCLSWTILRACLLSLCRSHIRVGDYLTTIWAYCFQVAASLTVTNCHQPSTTLRPSSAGRASGPSPIGRDSTPGYRAGWPGRANGVIGPVRPQFYYYWLPRPFQFQISDRLLKCCHKVFEAASKIWSDLSAAFDHVSPLSGSRMGCRARFRGLTDSVGLVAVRSS